MKSKRFVSFLLVISCSLLLLIPGCKSGTSTTSTPTTTSTTAQTVDLANVGAVKMDVTYATIAGVDIKMDIYYPKVPAQSAPLVIYLHGGGWDSGDKSSTGYVYIPFLVSSGYVVANVNYRLAPDYKIQSQIEDVKCAVRFLKAHAAEYGIDKTRIGVLGTSAGAQLAALLGTSDNSAGLEGSGGYNNESSRVQAVVDIAGPVDLVTYTSLAQRQTYYFGNGVFPDIEQKLSAGTYISSDDPPFLIIHGDKDTTVPLGQSVLFYKQLLAAKVPATLVIQKNAGHGYEPIGGPISPTQDELNTMIVSFYDRYLK